VTIKKIKLGKISIVVFLTALIWVWADLAQDERLNLPDVVIAVAKSSNPALWACFVAPQDEPDLQTSVVLDSVVLKGPASRVAEIRRRKNKGILDLGLFLAPEQEGITKAEVHTVDVLEFVKQSDEFRQLGLTVESCEPKKLTLRVQELVKMTIPVEPAGLPAAVQVSVVPETVEAYVPKDEVGVRKAIVRLTSEEQNRAKTAAVEKMPYIELVPGQRREVLDKVKISLTPAQNVLNSYRVPAAVGFCFNQNMQGKYRVVLKNDPTDLDNVMIKATKEAQLAYTQSLYQLILYIQDSDRQATEPIERAVAFNFPDDFLQKDEIKADPDQQLPKAKFLLQPIPETNVETKP
jgi:hypothetical protein